MNAEANAGLKASKKAEITAKRKGQLKTFLSQVAKAVSEHNYHTLMRQATSLQWVYFKIRKDYNIQQKGVH